MAEPLLRPGASGEAVRELQQALKGLGYDPGPVGRPSGASKATAA